MKDKKKMIVGIIFIVLAIGISAGTYGYYRATTNKPTVGTILTLNCGEELASGSLNLGSLKAGSHGTFAFKVKTDYKANIELKMRFSNTDFAPTKLEFYKENKNGNTIALNRVGGTESDYVTVFSDKNISNETDKLYTIFYNWEKDSEKEIDLGKITEHSLVLNYILVCEKVES